MVPGDSVESAYHHQRAKAVEWVVSGSGNGSNSAGCKPSEVRWKNRLLAQRGPKESAASQGSMMGGTTKTFQRRAAGLQRRGARPKEFSFLQNRSGYINNTTSLSAPDPTLARPSTHTSASWNGTKNQKNGIYRIPDRFFKETSRTRRCRLGHVFRLFLRPRGSGIVRRNQHRGISNQLPFQKGLEHDNFGVEFKRRKPKPIGSIKPQGLGLGPPRHSCSYSTAPNVIRASVWTR